MREGRIGFDEKLEVGQATDSEKLRESLSPSNVSQSRRVQHNDQYLRPLDFRGPHLSASPPPPNDPTGHKRFDTDDLSRLLSKSPVHDGLPLGKEKFTSESWNDNVHVTQTYEEEGDICEQCRLEEMHMSMLRQKADAERIRHEEAERKARQLELEMQEKERRIAEEAERKRNELKEHIDEINRQLMTAKKAQKEATPTQDTNNFLWSEEKDPKLDALRKTDYREFLEKQMEEKQRKKAEQADFERSMMTIQSGGKSNIGGSGSRIEIREEEEESDAREARVQTKAKDMARKQLEFQAELAKRQGRIPREESWMWWAERPDEHGWREARMKAKNDQIDRNLQMENAIVMLEDFKRRQAEEDKANREARMAKYEKLREQANEEASKLSMSMKRHSRPTITPDPRVEAAWKEAHEKTDRRYRLLQNGDNGQSQENNQGQSQAQGQAHSQSQGHSSAGPSFVDVNAHTSCRRCIRCSRPLERRAKHSVKVGESIHPTALTWYPK